MTFTVCLFKISSMMVNFICWLNWARWCLDIWSNFILSMSLRECMLNKIIIWIWVKQIAIPNVDVSHSVMPNSLQPHELCSLLILQARKLEWVATPLCPGIFLRQRLNPGLLHCREILYPLSNHLKAQKELKGWLSCDEGIPTWLL